MDNKFLYLLRFHYYAYHTRMDPTFSSKEPSMSSWHHYDITPIMTSPLHHYDLICYINSTMTSSLEHYKYASTSL